MVVTDARRPGDGCTGTITYDRTPGPDLEVALMISLSAPAQALLGTSTPVIFEVSVLGPASSNPEGARAVQHEKSTFFVPR